MIERLLRHMLSLLLGIVALLFLLGLVLGIARDGGTVAVTSITRAIPNMLAGFVGTVVAGIFLIGLGVRVHQFLTGHGGREGRDRGARERQVRLTVRRLAEGVPATSAPAVPEDPDPAISLEEG